MFVLLVNIESPFHQHIPCDIVVVFGYLRLIILGLRFGCDPSCMDKKVKIDPTYAAQNPRKQEGFRPSKKGVMYGS